MRRWKEFMFHYVTVERFHETGRRWEEETFSFSQKIVRMIVITNCDQRKWIQFVDVRFSLFWNKIVSQFSLTKLKCSFTDPIYFLLTLPYIDHLRVDWFKWALKRELAFTTRHFAWLDVFGSGFVPIGRGQLGLPIGWWRSHYKFTLTNPWNSLCHNTPRLAHQSPPSHIQGDRGALSESQNCCAPTGIRPRISFFHAWVANTQLNHWKNKLAI